MEQHQHIITGAQVILMGSLMTSPCVTRTRSVPKLLRASYLIYSMLACEPPHMFPSSIIQSCTLSHWFPLEEGFHQRWCELGELVVCPRVLQTQEETAQLFCMLHCCFMEECSARHLRGFQFRRYCSVLWIC